MSDINKDNIDIEFKPWHWLIILLICIIGSYYVGYTNGGKDAKSLTNEDIAINIEDFIFSPSMPAYGRVNSLTLGEIRALYMTFNTSARNVLSTAVSDICTQRPKETRNINNYKTNFDLPVTKIMEVCNEISRQYNYTTQ